MFKYFLASLVLVANIIYQSNATEIKILHFGDTHGNCTNLAPRDNDGKSTTGGLSRLATYVGLTKLNNPNTIVLNNGDFSIGDLMYNKFFAVPELTIFKAIGVDALTLGNHEFDLGPLPIIQILNEGIGKDSLAMPVLSTNIIIRPQFDYLKPLANFIKPTKIFNFDGVKVGVFGFTSPKTMLLSNPDSLLITDNSQIIYQTAMSLREQGCNIVILLSGLGLKNDKDIAEAIPGIDIIIGGDDHFVPNKEEIVVNSLGNKVYLAQAGPFFRNIGCFTITYENEIKKIKWDNIELNNKIPQEPTIQAKLDELEAILDLDWDNPVTKLITEINKDMEDIVEPKVLCNTESGYSDSEVGNLVCDAYLWKQPECDLSLCPGGNFGQQIYKGKMYGVDVYRVLGYGFNTDDGLGFRLATFTMSGLDLIKGLEFGMSEIESSDEFFLFVAGAKVFYSPSKEPGNRITAVLINGKPIELDKEYKIVSNEYVLMVLDKLNQLLGLDITIKNPVIKEGVAEYEVLRDYLSTKKSWDPPQKNRIYRTSEADVEEHNSNNLVLYPTPATNTIIFKNLEEETENCEIKIYDTNGNFIVFDNSNSNELNLSNLSNGTYIFSLKMKGKIYTKKFVIAR